MESAELKQLNEKIKSLSEYIEREFQHGTRHIHANEKKADANTEFRLQVQGAFSLLKFVGIGNLLMNIALIIEFLMRVNKP